MDRKSGYTLIELLIILAITAFVGVLAFYGVNDFNVNQSVSDAQKNFVAQLRTAQNKATVGADGLNFQKVQVPGDVTLPGEIMVTPGVTVCFANSLLSSYTTGQCGGCSGGSFFACTSGNIPVNDTFTVTFTRGQVSKSVRIDGNGTVISKIYAVD